MDALEYTSIAIRHVDPGYSASPLCTSARAMRKAAIAIAAAEAALAAQPVAEHAGRWYCIARDGAATLCKDEEDARANARHCDLSWPKGAPHRAVRFVEADATDMLRADLAEEQRLNGMGAEREARLMAQEFELRREVERLRADAERYRLLRDRRIDGWAICEWIDEPDGVGYYGDARPAAVVDAAIDAARNTKEQP